VVVQAARLSLPIGFVAAGGRSRRMGTDKALLPWSGSTLLDHALARLRAVTPDVRILSGSQPRYRERGVPLVLDGVPDAGPLGGLDAALAAAAGRPVLLLAVDLPFVTTAVLERLLEGLEGWDAAVPVLHGRPEPLCAVYGPACREAVRDRLQAGERRMTAFFEDVRIHALTEQALEGLGDIVSLFRNLNSPEDLEGGGG
jgi:molybdopterin-guanine dinucleotide biosynthesis protein A